MDIEPHKRIATEELVIGYAMSRLDRAYLAARGLQTWKAAYSEVSVALGRPPSSFKNLRDEFDPLHGNDRAGWWNRDIRDDRRRVLVDLADSSNEALMALVDSVIRRDADATEEAIVSLAEPRSKAYNVAERLLTGRRAEEHFLANCQAIVGVEREAIDDLRNAALGYDFGVVSRPLPAIEVKGIRGARGGLLFTDREWCEARHRGGDYWLVVVACIETDPEVRVVRNPTAALDAACVYQRSISASWRAMVDARSVQCVSCFLG